MRNTYRELSKSGFSLSMLSEGNEGRLSQSVAE